MATSLEDWEKHYKKLAQIPKKQLVEQVFFRDPTRPNILDLNHFYSPADGILLYQKVIEPKQPIEIKGKHFLLTDLFEDEHIPTKPCLVVGIFMTMYDVHVNRVPYSGVLTFRELPPIITYNEPMDPVQNDLLRNRFPDLFNHMHYERYNARMINTFYNPQLDYRYHLIQIADDEVNVFTHFTTLQSQFFHQNQRFSFVRRGSQVNLILPMDKRYKFTVLVPDAYHVAGSVDRLVKIDR